MLGAYFDAFAQDYAPYKGGAWCYEDGCIYRGLGLLHRATGDKRWLGHLSRMVDAQVSANGALAGYSVEEFNIDNILAGRALIYLYGLSGKERYLNAARHLGRQLEEHPRTRSGVYWHKNIYPRQVWLDGLYMGLPFQIELGLLTGNDDLVEDALRQISTALDLTYRTETGLYAHGYDESRTQSWSDPRSGQSPTHWARALGWLAMALVDVIELVSVERAEKHRLVSRTRALFERILSLRTKNGLWLQVIDMPALRGNYEESSASAMFAYALLCAGRLNILPGATRAGETALETLVATSVQLGDKGRPEFLGICHVAGLGGYGERYRDGTPAYYLTEKVVADDPKGVGPLIMAAAEEIMAKAALDTV
ncbi:glycoside hydrolase family 88 protein [Corticibacterium sp. UT-5YL-CI-8]|nr:glycoside hydrolase family 88 protein [Tianweitania sp. UT-5YL-CI-8]